MSLVPGRFSPFNSHAFSRRVRRAGLALLTGASLVIGAAPARAVVVLNEVLGSTESTDWEYIELYNSGVSAVDISGWKVELWDSDAGSSFGGADGGSPFFIPSTTILAGGGHYLLANQKVVNEFNNIPAPSQILAQDFVENSSYTVLLVNQLNAVVDSAFVRDSGPSDSANRAGVALTPNITAGPDGTFLPPGFTRTTDGGGVIKLLDFNYTDLENPSYTDPVYSRGTPQNDGVTFIASSNDLSIAEIQGAGVSSPFSGQGVKTTGIVTKVNDNGFFIQDPVGDANPVTSEGIFVFTGNAPSVAVGSSIQVTGVVSDAGLTQIGGQSLTIATLSTGNPLPAPVSISFPVTNVGDLEAFEGMLIRVDQPADAPLRLTEYFNLDRFGEVRLSPVLFDQFTDANLPSVAGNAAHLAEVARHTITLDDGRSGENLHPIALVGDPLPPANDPVKVIRRGDIVTNVQGVLDFGFGRFNIDPTVEPTITSDNPRPSSSDVGGSLQVASFNLLNYFNGNGDGTGFPTSRGAANPAEFMTQQQKAVAAIRGTGAEIIGLQELENDGDTSIPSIQTLVNALNAAAVAGEHWSFINTGKVGTDEITTGFIYRDDKVAPVGAHAILDSSVDPDFLTGFEGNRPAIAQTFMELATGEKLTLAVNHFKSKNTGPGAVGGNADIGDGQAAFNERRLLAAQALANWLATDPTSSGDRDFLILGDLNSYRFEDPIQALLASGYVDLLATFAGDDAYSFIFDGQAGSLDQMLANHSLLPQVTGLIEWHINADEPDVYDYITRFGKDPAYTASGAFRSSDHDPIIIGLNLQTIPEPSTALVASLGAAALGLRRRSTRRS